MIAAIAADVRDNDDDSGSRDRQADGSDWLNGKLTP